MFDFYEVQDIFWTRIAWAGGVPSIAEQLGPGLLTVDDVGVGIVRINLPAGTEIPNTRTIVRITPRAAVAAFAVWDEAASDDNDKEIRVFNAAGAVDDIPLTVELKRLCFPA